MGGPYLLDSGWFSAVVYRQGLLPDNPPCAHPLREYFGVHLSLLLSMGSMLSYLLPIDRVPFYCLFQGLIYAPLGAVTAMLLFTRGAGVTLGQAPAVLATSVLFALNGETLSCLGYPHFEIFLSVGLCIMLVGIACGRVSLAWVGMALAGATREDGGFHALFFSAAALVCYLSGRPFPLPRSTLIRIVVASALTGVVAIVVQRVSFESANTFRLQFTGNPPFEHVTAALMKQRLLALPERAGFVVFPLVGTLAIAALTRDFRYLLGWVAELPWTLVCLIAMSDGKASLASYNGFPFVASIFWVGAYGMIGKSPFGARHWLAGLAGVSALSIAGAYISHPNLLATIRVASIPGDVAYAGIAQFSRDLEGRRGFYGNVLVDPGVASWAIMGMPRERCVSSLMTVAAPHSYEGVAFFRRGFLGGQIERFIDKSPFSQCGRIPTSEVFLCTRPNRTLPLPFVSSSLDG
jgi:hypothetical protein